jgi:hypothetical protein
MLGLHGRYVGSKGNRDGQKRGNSKEHAAMQRKKDMTHHPQRVAVERPSDSIWNRVSNQPLS